MKIFQVLLLAVLAVTATSGSRLLTSVRKLQAFSDITDCDAVKLAECQTDVFKKYEDLEDDDCNGQNAFFQEAIFCEEDHCDDHAANCAEKLEETLDALEELNKQLDTGCPRAIAFCTRAELGAVIWAGMIGLSLIIVIIAILVVKARNPDYVDGKIVCIGLVSCLFFGLGAIIFTIVICCQAGKRAILVVKTEHS